MLTKSPTMFSSIIQWATEERPLELPRRIRIAIPILILGLALGLRIHLAGLAYPAQLDSTHMIQQGILWVQGEPGALSTIWQEFPVLTAGIAYRLGYNPAEALQWSTVIFGTILVGMTMLLTRRLFDSNAAAWIAGMWATTNPALLNYSVNSMPEIGFAACLVSAYAVLASAIGGQSLKPVPILTGYALLALGIYFKPLDSLAAFALTTGWLFLVHVRRMTTISLFLLLGLLIYVAVVTPHYVLQNQGNKSGNFELANRAAALAKGTKAYDSKYENAPRDAWFVEEFKEYNELGALKWLWRHRQEVSRRYVSNLMLSLRIYGQDLFPQAFRIGNALWLAMLMAILAIRLWSPQWKTFLWLLLAVMIFPLGVSLSYVYSRWLIIYIPLIIIIVSGHLVLSPSLWGRRWKMGCWCILLLVMASSATASSLRAHRDQIWSQNNLQAVVQWFKENTNQDDRFMSLGPSISLEIDIDHPQRWVRLPNAPLEHIERICRQQRVSYVLVSDTSYPHWPANQLVHGQSPPPNWALATEMNFKQVHPVWGEQEERYQIYKRSPPVTESSP